MKYNYGLKLPKAETMIKECERLGLETYNMKPIELFFQLAGTESKLQCLSGVYAFKRNIDPEKLAQIKEKNMMIPEKTVMPRSRKTEIMGIINEDPQAFNGYNFFDAELPVQFVFKHHVICNAFGTEFFLTKTHKKRIGRDKIIEHELVDQKKCPKCERNFIYLQPRETTEDEIPSPIIIND